MNKRPETAILGGLGDAAVVLLHSARKIGSMTRIVATRNRIAEDVYEKHCGSGAPGESRTPDLLVRSQTLYPAELRARDEGSLA
jgi:hypothetical protein